LAFIIPVEVAAPIAVLISITVALIIIIQDWRQIHFGSAYRLTLASLVGTPIGLWLLAIVPESAIKAVLAVIIISFSVFSLSKHKPTALKSDKFAWVFGFLSGILGGAYAINGPPIVIYGTLRRWSPQHFRATLQGYFLPSSLFILIG